MNIGILIPGFSDGEQDWCIPVYLNLVRTLAQSDLVRVFALRYPPRRTTYPVYGAQVFALGAGSSAAGVARWSLLARTLASVVRQHQVKPFDVLHAIWADETGFIASVAGRVLGVPVVVSVAGGELVSLPGYGLQAGRVSSWLVRQALSHADRVTAPCQYAADLTRAAMPDPARLTVVPLGVDTQLFCVPAPDHRENRLLSVGSLTNVKGHDRLIDALSWLPASIGLDIVGEGPLLSTLREQADRLGIADRVTLHGAVSHDQLPRFYQSAALHVLPSRHEAFGMVVTEAAACGLPTVGFRVGVLKEFAESQAGRAVSPEAYNTLGAVIRAVMEDEPRRVAMADRARRLVDERYTLAAMAGGMRRVYMDLVG